MRLALVHVYAHDHARGIVRSLHDTLSEAIAATPVDEDGCRAANVRYWRTPDAVQVGTSVVLFEPPREDAP